jgi:hypothetical protein
MNIAEKFKSILFETVIKTFVPMPYYLVEYKVKKKKPVKIVREYQHKDIEQLYLYLLAKSREQYGNDLLSFDCKMISKYSSTYKSLHRSNGQGQD